MSASEPVQDPIAEQIAARADPPSAPPVGLGEAFRVWAKIGLMSFGGPAGQIAMMHRILVDERRWIGESRFLHALNYCMLLPGPEATQLAIYVGWLLHRTTGGLIAGTLFVLPGFFVILALSMLYAGLQDLALVQALFFGIKAAVLAVVIEAVHRIGRRALRNPAMVMIAAAAFIAIFVFHVPFPLIVLAAGAIGLLGGRLAPDIFIVIKGHGDARADGGMAIVDAMFARGRPEHTRPSARRAIGVSVVCLALWLGPIAVLALLRGASDVFVQAGIFFSQMALVTFGGAYAVLAYVTQEAVSHYGWLQPGEMLDGLGLAETTPGPLILVTEFVGFLAAYRNAGGLDPMLAGALGAVLTVWVTFVPCFLWIFLGAPYVESLSGRSSLSAALSAITAAVVGVILNLAIWFALHVFFAELAEWRGFGTWLLLPVWRTLDPVALVLAAGALVALFRFKLGMLPVLGASALLGAAYFITFR